VAQQQPGTSKSTPVDVARTAEEPAIYLSGVVISHGGLARIQDLARTGPMTAVCASGTVIRHLIADLADDCGLAMGEVPAKNGSAWVLFFSGGRLAGRGLLPGSHRPRG